MKADSECQGLCRCKILNRGVYPSMHWGRHPPPSDTFPGETHPPWANTPTRPTATAADGTHPTRILSCFIFHSNIPKTSLLQQYNTTRMHSSRMHTAMAISPATRAPLPRMPPCYTYSLPCTPPATHAPLPCTNPPPPSPRTPPGQNS